MKTISFHYPFMVFQKCDCKQQVPIDKMSAENEDDGTKISWNLTCSCCNKQIRKCYYVKDGIENLTKDVRAYKIIPSIKDEIALVKLESFKVKIKNNDLFFFGNYSHLRFFDNVIEDDILPVFFTSTLND
ncbi:MAG: hypothetical protein ACOWWR_10490 [Eubacteriales bacterium]